MNSTDDYLSEYRAKLGARQANPPVVDGILQTVQLEIETMVIDDETEQKKGRSGGDHFDEPTQNAALVLVAQ